MFRLAWENLLIYEEYYLQKHNVTWLFIEQLKQYKEIIEFYLNHGLWARAE